MGSIAVIMATRGRPSVCAEAIGYVLRSTLPADWQLSGIVSVADASDAPEVADSDWAVVIGPAGLAAQRNTALAALDGTPDFVFFFDDDTVIRDDYLAVMISYFNAHADVVAVTGHVAADGAAEKREIPLAEADALLQASTGARHARTIARHNALYGCNFGVRWSELSAARFDEALPLYSWLEDHDYARRAMRHGRLAKVGGAVMVHRGANSGGRTQHVRLGYSQIANPVWLYQKGSFPWWLAARQIARPVLANVVLGARGLRGSTFRRDRLRGNLLAVRDLVANGGRATPGRIVGLQ